MSDDAFRNLLSSSDFKVLCTVKPNPLGIEPMELRASSFGSISLVDLLRTNKRVTIVKDDDTILTYEGKSLDE